MGWVASLLKRAEDALFGPEPSIPSPPPPPPPPNASRPPPVTTSACLRSERPLVAESPSLDGGTQGLREIEQSLRRDEDGDEAHDFIVVDEAPG